LSQTNLHVFLMILKLSICSLRLVSVKDVRTELLYTIYIKFIRNFCMESCGCYSMLYIVNTLTMLGNVCVPNRQNSEGTLIQESCK